jgi:hypothetical protein
MNFSKPIVKLTQPEGAFMINLGQFKAGPVNALNTIPKATAGIYSWFKTFDYSEDSDLLFQYLERDLLSEKFAERTGSVNPYYEVAIRSRSQLSPNKRKQIRLALNDDNFCVTLAQALSSSVMFQSPLYVGKSNDLRNRIESHLQTESPLRSRLSEVGISIDRCQLLVVPLYNIEVTENMPEGVDSELLFEEIFSRLFNPLFTLRLG